MEASFNPPILKDMVQKAAKQTGKTLYDVLSEIGITPTAYYSYVNGKRLPDLLTLSKLARYFKVSRDFFFKDEDEGEGGLLVAAPVDVVQVRRKKTEVDESQMRLLAQRIEELQAQLSEAIITLKGRGVALSGRVALWLHGWLHPGLAAC